MYGMVRMNVTFHLGPSTSYTTFLISLKQMDSHYRYPVNYYNVDSNHTVAIHSKNACANKSINILHIRSYHQHPLSTKLQLTNLRCLLCLALPVAISASNNLSRDVSNPTRWQGKVTIPKVERVTVYICFSKMSNFERNGSER